MGVGVVIERIRDHDLGGQHQPAAAFCEQCARRVEHFIFNQRIAHRDTLRLEESVCHAAADQQHIAFAQQRFDHADLVGYFRAAQNGDEWTLRRFDGAAQVVQFLFHQEPSDGRQKVGHALGGGVGAVG